MMSRPFPYELIYFSKQSNQLEGSKALPNFTQEDLIRMFSLPKTDPLVLNYEVNEEQAPDLKNKYNINFQFQNYSYFIQPMVRW